MARPHDVAGAIAEQCRNDRRIGEELLAAYALALVAGAPSGHRRLGAGSRARHKPLSSKVLGSTQPNRTTAQPRRGTKP